MLANDMTKLLDKIERRLGLVPLQASLPKGYQKSDWAKIIDEQTLDTFSRYYPHKFPLVVSDETCIKEYRNENDLSDKNRANKAGYKTVWYYIKDEVLEGVKLLGIEDIDWMDYTTNNSSLGATSMGGGYYYPNFACPEATFDSVISLQMNADMSSLYNRGIYIDFEYPNRFSLKGLGNTNYDLNNFVVILLVKHNSLATISPTKMDVFEELAMADIAEYLYNNLKYFDNLETIYVNIDMKMSDLQDQANKRQDVIERLKESYVSTSNDNIPYIFTV